MAWPGLLGIDKGKVDQSMRGIASSMATIILVHDAFQTPAHFEGLSHELEENGCTVIRPQLPSSTFTYQAGAFGMDVETIYEAGRSELENGRSIVMVMSGYGAIPGPVAAEKLNAFSLDRPRAGLVLRLVFLSGVVLGEGQSYSDLVQMERHASEGGLVYPSILTCAVFPQEVNNIAVHTLQLHVEEVLYTRVESPGWTHIPCLYVICELDDVFDVLAQDACVAKMRKANRDVCVTRIKSGHVPHITSPAHVASLLGVASKLDSR
ncbi:hypothetical protein K431DRAFT_224796 [Polychaeton citri CBS 116435]|uniref:AB hydrolase-1 domain-containing protein n=1 Tax=Polychaeton citri CBS 116435 TaxID=1314669 RepID=A0A9P4Q5X4_9PEZI|nr:hypothetical protein K431DRAFT_224796 [Polychaeton citri CBS 116435]